MSLFIKLNKAGEYETTQLPNGLAPVTDLAPSAKLKFDINYVSTPDNVLDVTANTEFSVDSEAKNLKGNVNVVYVEANGTAKTTFGDGFDEEDPNVVAYSATAPAAGVYAFVFTYEVNGTKVERLTYSLEE